jgi:hypothetical protein
MVSDGLLKIFEIQFRLFPLMYPFCFKWDPAKSVLLIRTKQSSTIPDIRSLMFSFLWFVNCFCLCSGVLLYDFFNRGNTLNIFQILLHSLTTVLAAFGAVIVVAYKNNGKVMTGIFNQIVSFTRRFSTGQFSISFTKLLDIRLEKGFALHFCITCL